jgi:hypothetical protein
MNPQVTPVTSTGTSPQTVMVTVAPGVAVAFGIWYDDKIYSICQLENGLAQPIDVFTVGRSAQIPNGQRLMTRVDTNLEKSGINGLPKDYEAYIFGISVMLTRVARANTSGSKSGQVTLADQNGGLSDPINLRTLFNFDRVTYVEFWYKEKPYATGTPQNFPAGHGYYLVTQQANVESANNGVPSPRDRVALVLPIHLNENLTFYGRFSPEAPIVINQPASDGGIAMTFADAKMELSSLIKRIVS